MALGRVNTGGGGTGGSLVVTAPAGVVATCEKDGRTYTRTVKEDGTATFNGLKSGVWTVTITKAGELPSSQEVRVTADYTVTLAFFSSLVTVVYPAGSTCTCTDGDIVLRATDTSGRYTFNIQRVGTWTISCTDGKQVATQNVSITATGQSKSVTLTYFSAAIKVMYPAGSTCTCTKDSTVLTATNTSGSYTFTVHEAGTYTVKATDGTQSKSVAVTITSNGESKSIVLTYRITPEFTYSGTYKIVNDSDVEISADAFATYVGNWKVRFLTSGTFNIVNMHGFAGKIDVFCVGGGGGSSNSAGTNSGTGGGGGGYTNTSKNVSVSANTIYAIAVGAGGAAAASGGGTSAFGLTANGGHNGSGRRGGAGGSGGGGGGYGGGGHSGGSDGAKGNGGGDNPGGAGQGTTTREFGIPTGTLYAGGGGGGGGGDNDGNVFGGGSGGAGGGGGANYGGASNTGGGGGGKHYSGGTAGGSGIVIIRNAR